MTEPQSASSLLELARREQRERWERGERAPAEEFLERLPVLAADRESLLDFVYSEFLLREEFGEVPTLEDYALRFPQLADELRDLFEVHWALPAAFPTESIAGGEETLLNGKVLGNYRILKQLGAGGMGVVFLAEHRRMQRKVALKVLAPEIAGNPEALARFHREAKAAARLEHPHIVRAYDADEADKTHFLVMEYVPGATLNELVKAQGTLPTETAVDYILQAAEGLDYAHQEGVIHRDIKPANLLLDKRGVVKILDMGLARIQADADLPGGESTAITGSHTLLGTVDYMAPEQAFDTKQADARSDIYSLGCTLWYLLTGKALFDGDTAIQKFVAHRELPLPVIRTLRPDVPLALEDVLRKMLEKSPAARYQSMAEVIRALSPWAKVTTRSSIGLIADIAPASNNATLEKSGFSKSSRGVLYGVVSLVLAAVAILAWSLSPRLQPGPAPSPRQAVVKTPDKAAALGAQPQPSPDNHAMRDAAEWVLSLGGSITIKTGAEKIDIVKLVELPEGPFAIDTVSLEYCRGITPQGALRLVKARQIHDLKFGYSDIDDTTLSELSGLNSVSVLRLGGTVISADGLRNFAGKNCAISQLDLGDTHIAASELQGLAPQFPHLRDLNCPDWAPDLSTIDALCQFQKLRLLNLNARLLKSELMQRLAMGLPSLDQICLRGEFGREQILSLQPLGKLRALGLDSGAIPLPGSFQALGELNSLEQVVSGNTVPNDSWLELTSVPKLRSVFFFYCSKAQPRIEELAKMPDLQTLIFVGSVVDQAALDKLQTLRPELEILINGQRRPGGLIASPSDPELDANVRDAADWVFSLNGWIAVKAGDQTLNLSQGEKLPEGPFEIQSAVLDYRQGITKVGISRLVKARHVHDLRFQYSDINDETLAALAPLNSVAVLRVEGTEISAEGLRQYAGAGCSVSLLYLGGTRITAMELGALAPQLRELYMLQCPDWPGELSTVDALCRFQKLTSLDVNPALLKTEPMQRLAAGLSKLSEIGLRGEISREQILTLKPLEKLPLVTIGEGIVPLPGSILALQELKSVTELVLKTVLPDDAWAELTSIPQLRIVHFHFCPQVQPRLDKLANIQGLQSLRFVGGALDNAALDKLQRLRPKLEIVIDHQLRPPPGMVGPVADEILRDAAEWIFSLGGSVVVKVGDKTINARQLTDLPDRPFTIDAVNLEKRRGITSQGASRLAKVRHVRELWFKDSDIQDDSWRHYPR